MSDTDTGYTREYFMDGPRSGLSNYNNYHWMPELTVPMARRLVKVLGEQITGNPNPAILDFGCARGYLVHALRQIGFDAAGFDTSQWAIEHCHPRVKEYVSNTLDLSHPYRHIVAKDVLEHIELPELEELIPRLWEATEKSMFFIVPLTDENGSYLRDEDENDPSHKIRWQMDEWVNFFYQTLDGEPTVWASPHVPGLKPASGEMLWSTGFFKITK